MKKLTYGALLALGVSCQQAPDAARESMTWHEVYPQLQVREHTISCSGMVEVPPQFRATVSAPLGGFVRQINHYVGDAVRQGEVLCVLENPEFIRLQEEMLASKSRLTFLEADARRKERMAEEDATSQRSLQMAQSAYEEEKARYQSLKATLAMVGLSEETLNRQGIVNQVSVKSPINGFVTGIPVNLGQFVRPEDMIYALIDPSHLHLEIRVFPSDIASVQPGMAFTYAVPGSPTRYEGHIKLVGKEVDEVHRAVVVHGHPKEEYEALLQPGTFVDVQIPLATDSLWVVPSEALLYKASKAFVLAGSVQAPDTVWIQAPQVGQGWLEVPKDLGKVLIREEDSAEEGHVH